MAEEITLTPAQKQYADLKNQYADCILFFRMGDFYETFREDAKTCAKLLDLTLTARDKHGANPIPMAGVPYHSVDKYIAKLVAHGLKIAIAEQISEPKPGHIVERKVTHVITPATFIEDSKKEFTYLAAVAYTGGENAAYQLAWGDVTIGVYHTQSFLTLTQLFSHLTHLQSREIVIDVDFPESQVLREYIQQQNANCLMSTYDKPHDGEALLRHTTGVQTLTSFGKALEEGRQHAMALLVNYLAYIQPHALQTLVRIQYNSATYDVMLDMVTLRNLEIIASQYESNKRYSLLGVLDYTVTALGARLFREILTHPTRDLQVLQDRQSHIAYYAQRSGAAKQIQEVLRHMVDMPKIISTILYKKALPTTFGKLRYALSVVHTAEVIEELHRLGVSDEAIGATKSYYEQLVAMLKSDGLNDDIDYINDGYDTHIDELRQIAYHSDGLLLAYQQELVQATGITNIKIKYISNQGYVLEVTPKDMSAFEQASVKGDAKQEFIRRQTLKTGQRYTTVYLDELQHKVLAAQFQLRSREQVLIDEAKAKLLSVVTLLQQIADGIAWLDIYTSHALFVLAKKYVKPELIDVMNNGGNKNSEGEDSGLLEILGGRHPVIEEFLPNDQQFIPNDLMIGERGGDNKVTSIQDNSHKYNTDVQDMYNKYGLLHIITGPNMGGKSTFLRQNALIVLMAHCGLFVPAISAKIPLVDGIFARVGSGDVIAKNQSTFMTEMIEMSNILHNATQKSFIILDELGRGTSTYDGMALAQAIVQYIVQHIGAKTLFATHYHELIAMENTLSLVKNYSVSVYETEKDIVFMKKIIPGGANKSYGLDVAKIAGVPGVIVETAKKYLSFHESQQQIPLTGNNPMPLFDMHIDRDAVNAKIELDRIKNILKSIDPNNMTPMQALAMIAKLKGDL